jgi:N-acyl-D-amino-acid deacylase
MNHFDLVIRNGALLDPARRQVTVGNVGIHAGKITALTREELLGDVMIDAVLELVCPGFIDIHAHVDGYRYSGECMARQGITTTVGGNCGMGPGDLEAFFREQEQGFPINQAMLIGHSFTLREQVGAADPYRPATREQIREMSYRAEKALAAGAAGISFGLEYAPGTSWEEIETLSKLAARYDKLVAVHLRSDSWAGLGALQEAIRINRITGARVQISHLTYQVGMGMMSEALQIIAAALAEGLAIGVDSGMYHAFATYIGSAVFNDDCFAKWGCDYRDLVAVDGPEAGQRLNAELYRDLRHNHPETVVLALVGNEAEVLEALLPRYVMVSSDGAVGHPRPGNGHPQDVGTFPCFFQKLVRETGRLSLMDAVERCTILPARQLGLNSKGRLQVGADADLVIFDPGQIADRAEYPGLGIPDRAPEGIRAVIVNGRVVVENGMLFPDVLPGTALRMENRLWNWI